MRGLREAPWQSGIRASRRILGLLNKSEQLKCLPLDDPAKCLARDDREVRSLGHLVHAVDGFDALGGAGVGEIRAEEQLVDYASLVSADQCVVGVPRASQQPADVGIDVVMFAK